MRLFIGRPRFTKAVATLLWFAGALVILTGFSLWAGAAFRHPPLVWLVSDQTRYHQFQQDIAKWDRLFAKDSVYGIDSLVPRGLHADSIHDTASARRYVVAGKRLLDHAQWVARQRDSARARLNAWLESGDRDTLGIHHR